MKYYPFSGGSLHESTRISWCSSLTWEFCFHEAAQLVFSIPTNWQRLPSLTLGNAKVGSWNQRKWFSGYNRIQLLNNLLELEVTYFLYFNRNVGIYLITIFGAEQMLRNFREKEVVFFLGGGGGGCVLAFQLLLRCGFPRIQRFSANGKQCWFPGNLRRTTNIYI